LTIAGVADSHAAIWYLFNDSRLSLTAGAFIDAAAYARQKIAVSSISLAEVVYLVEKNRLLPAVYDELVKALADSEHVFTEAVFTAAIVQSMRQVARAQVPDMPDRMIAATALYLNVPVISRDGRILANSLKTVW
jgi:PIN domain nuclease of toxin-antitoxin system